METSEILAEYLRLEKELVAANEDSEKISDQIDPLWDKLTEEERESPKYPVQPGISENLAKYLELEKQMIAADNREESIRDQMYPLMDKLTDEECMFLNERLR